MAEPRPSTVLYLGSHHWGNTFHEDIDSPGFIRCSHFRPSGNYYPYGKKNAPCPCDLPAPVMVATCNHLLTRVVDVGNNCPRKIKLCMVCGFIDVQEDTPINKIF